TRPTTVPSTTLFRSTIDKTAPTVSSINRADATPTNASSVHYTVTFSESVSGVDGSDFALTNSGVSGDSISGVSRSGSRYTVTVRSEEHTSELQSLRH